MAEIFDLENTPKLLTGPNQHLLDIFFEIQYVTTQRGSPRSTCFMGHFESVFRALFSCGIYIVNEPDSKRCFRIILTLWSNPYMHSSCLGRPPKHLIFRNAPKPIIDLYGISFLCTNFETFTIFSAVVLIDCPYPPYYLYKTKF